MQLFRLRNLCAVAAISLATSIGPADAGKKDDTLRVAMAEEILNLDYNYTTKREYIILASSPTRPFSTSIPSRPRSSPPSPRATHSSTIPRWT